LRSYLWRWLGSCFRLFCGRQLRGALFLLTAITGVGFAFAGDSVTVEAQEYSAYDDPERAALSFVLSEDQNVEEFQAEFGLGDGQIGEVRAAILRENEALAQAHAESEQIVEANKGLEALLPEDRRGDLATWVDSKFAQQEREFSEVSASTYQTSARRRGVSCKVFATQYRGYTRSEVALPHRILKDRGGYTVSILRGKHTTKAKVKEVGPWNIRDNYWESRKHRDMWDNLPRCTPEAQAAYFKNYHRGKDQFGRKVLNPAGVDLTPRVASRLGLRKYENAWVRVRYPWVGR
jgi:hypothetical protein